MTTRPTPAHAAGPMNTPSANRAASAAMVTAQRIDDRARARYERTAELDVALAMSAITGEHVGLRQAATWWQS